MTLSSVEASIQAFGERLHGGPAFLFLGQSYLGLGRASDPFLGETIREFGEGRDATSFRSLLDSEAGSGPDSMLHWMANLAHRLDPPTWLCRVAEYEWNAVYSSSIDPIWVHAFRNEWRHTHSIYEEKYRPSDPRNVLNLHCTYLFGCVNQVDDDMRPPLTFLELLARQQIAVSLARRIEQDLTPLGTLVIEGYTSGDWFDETQLAPIIARLQPGQTHIFSATPELASSPILAGLGSQGRVVFHSESLAHVLDRLDSEGLLPKGIAENIDEVRTVAFRDHDGKRRRVTVPIGLWTRTSSSAIVLDERVTEEPSPLTPDLGYNEFRSFLGSTDGAPRWSAYARNFAFARDFQAELERAVDSSLSSRGLATQPLILHGPSGTGKTVGLSLLAFRVRRAGLYPVLFIPQRISRPSMGELDEFCQWAEEEGAAACLVVWDGLQPVEEYARLLGQLTARGRRVVLVGSAYRQPAPTYDTKERLKHRVEAPGYLSPEEVGRLKTFLSRFDENLGKLLERERGLATDPYFLVYLYRMLPPSRGRIREGVSRELQEAEERMGERAAQRPSAGRAQTALEYALLKAGFVPSSPLSSESERNGENSSRSIEKLTNFIMVPGQFGLRVPLELLVRVVGATTFAQLVHIIEHEDVFQWFGDEAAGNIEIGPRTPLEAQLIVQSRFTGPAPEVETVAALLLELHDDSSSNSDSPEVDFAIALVRALREGPNREKTRYAEHLRSIALTLRKLREERGVQSPRLMLQEGNLFREWAQDRNNALPGDPEARGALRMAEDAVSKALHDVGQSPRGRQFRSTLMVELASIRASAARTVLDGSGSTVDAVGQFNAARDAALTARRLDPSNYYPIDVLAWSTMDIVYRGVLSESETVERIADVLHAFETASPDEFDVSQIDKYYERRLKVGDLLNLPDLSDSAFDALIDRGSAAGVYLRTVRAADIPTRDEPLTEDAMVRFRGALEYLKGFEALIADDARCLDLRLDLWWMVHTGLRPFEGERVVLALNAIEWRDALDFIAAALSTGQSYRPLVLSFLKGLAEFHLGNVRTAKRTFDQLEVDSQAMRGRRRVHRAYVASSASGEPMIYNGQVIWVDAMGSKGDIQVESLRERIRFLANDFHRNDLSRGDSLGQFHIAFNFLGPIADPLDRYPREGRRT